MQWCCACIDMSMQQITRQCADGLLLHIWELHPPCILVWHRFLRNVLFCQTVWWLSESICQKHPSWRDNKLHANAHAPPPPTHRHEKNIKICLSNKAYGPIPRELALHVFDKWTYTSPSISCSSRAQARQAPVYFASVSFYIKSTNQGDVSHASQLTADKLAVAMQERFIHSDDTLPISVRWKPHVFCLFGFSRRKQIHRQTEGERDRERGASNQTKLKALTVSFQIWGIWLAGLKCDWGAEETACLPASNAQSPTSADSRV